jgi:hypothetical protein
MGGGGWWWVVVGGGQWINRSLQPLIEPPRITLGKVKSYALLSDGEDQRLGQKFPRTGKNAG